MKRSLKSTFVILGAVGTALFLATGRATAVGVFYADPGWAYAYDGDEAYYHDPDGPNPDYINGNDQNQPGGQGGQPALVAPPSGCEPNCGEISEWIGTGQWEGSAPGEPLGGVPTGTPPLPPPAPGGVGTYTGGDGANFLRIQDAGNPQDYGWADKGAQANVGTALQEGNNRRMLFGHNLANDAAFSGNAGVIDNGITISFRTRLATRATGPLDDIFDEGGTTLADTTPWPEDGLGYEVHTEGRGMFMVTQTGTGGPGQMGFSLLDDDTVTAESLAVNVGAKRGLVMNGRSNPTGSPSTNSVTPATANVFEIPDDELDEWQEFWITIHKLPVPISGNTHEMNVYHNGLLTPQPFQFILDLENEFSFAGNAFLGMGLSSDTRQGAFDVDFFAYKEGIFAPTLAGLPGDHNKDRKVDVADYVAWRKLPSLFEGDPTGYNNWRENFGESQVGAGGSPVPEITPTILGLFVALICSHRLFPFGPDRQPQRFFGIERNRIIQ